MAPHTPDQLPRDSVPSGAPEVRRVRAQEALADYDRHGGALFSLALLLCRDADRAADAVVATLTRADLTAPDLSPDVKRQHLAADLWNRCAGVSRQDRALLGLVVFGGHTYGQAAALIGLPASSAAGRFRTLLHRA
ncbi:hypothetical protein ACFWVT_32540 [Streptomyces cyaneofuscatus]|uniref:hypothetical protein n=1 Tax=Streptomyces cyaneofuscatus TaxID=66883 RepID=UPI00366786A5